MNRHGIKVPCRLCGDYLTATDESQAGVHFVCAARHALARPPEPVVKEMNRLREEERSGTDGIQPTYSKKLGNPGRLRAAHAILAEVAADPEVPTMLRALAATWVTERQEHLRRWESVITSVYGPRVKS